MKSVTIMCTKAGRRSLLVLAGAVALAGAPWCPSRDAWARNGGGGAGEAGTATHQHLDSRFSHNRYYYDRGYAVHRVPTGGVSTGDAGEQYYFQGGNWYRWRGDWYRSWGGAWVVVDAPKGVLIPVLPPHYTTLWWNGTPYYYANDTYYAWQADQHEYRVVAPPQGLTSAQS